MSTWSSLCETAQTNNLKINLLYKQSHVMMRTYVHWQSPLVNRMETLYIKSSFPTNLTIQQRINIHVSCPPLVTLTLLF